MTAKWLVDMAKYISDNPHITVSGFLRSGIPGALDGFNAEFEADNELFGGEIISDDDEFESETDTSDMETDTEESLSTDSD